VKAPDDAAHARADHDVDRDPSLFKHFQDPDVGEPPGGAAAERQRDDGTGRFPFAGVHHVGAPEQASMGATKRAPKQAPERAPEQSECYKHEDGVAQKAVAYHDDPSTSCNASPREGAAADG